MAYFRCTNQKMIYFIWDLFSVLAPNSSEICHYSLGCWTFSTPKSLRQTCPLRKPEVYKFVPLAKPTVVYLSISEYFCLYCILNHFITWQCWTLSDWAQHSVVCYLSIIDHCYGRRSDLRVWRTISINNLCENMDFLSKKPCNHQDNVRWTGHCSVMPSGWCATLFLTHCNLWAVI